MSGAAARRRSSGPRDRFGDRVALRGDDERVVLRRARRAEQRLRPPPRRRGVRAARAGGGDDAPTASSSSIAVNAISKLGAAAVLLSPAWKAVEVDHALGAHRADARGRRRRRRRAARARLGADAVTDLDDHASTPSPLDRRTAPFDGPRSTRTTRRSSCSARAPPGCPRRCATPTARSAPRTAPLGRARSASAPTTASRWRRRRRTSSACSTCSPRPRPAPPCACTAASTSTRCCAASSPTASPSRWRSPRSRWRWPTTRTSRTTTSRRSATSCGAPRRSPRAWPRPSPQRTGVRWLPGLRRQRAAGASPATRSTDPDAWRLDSAGLPPAERRAARRRPRHRRGARARRDRRDPGPEPVGHGRLPARRGQRRRVRRRLVPHRRRRLARARGLGAPHRPLEGDDQGQRLPGGAGRGRGRAARPPRRARLRRVRHRRRAGRRGAGRRGAARPRPRRSTTASSSSSSPTRWPPTSTCATSWSSTPSRGCRRARCCAARCATSGRRSSPRPDALMDVRLSPEQQALRDSAVQVVDRLGPRTVGELDDAERAAKLDAAVDAAGWRELRTGDDDGAPWASASRWRSSPRSSRAASPTPPSSARPWPPSCAAEPARRRPTRRRDRSSSPPT